MSFIPNIVNRAYNVNVAMSRRLATCAGSSIIVPVAEQTLDANEFGSSATILMDHPRLPPMQEFDLGYGLMPFMGHDFNGEFVYECMAQQNSGAFHHIGSPGLFSVGAVRWSTVHNVTSDYDFTYSISLMRMDRNVDGDVQASAGTVKVLKGVEQATFFMRPGDYFKLTFEPTLNPHRWEVDSNQYTVFGYSDISVTRITSSPSYERVLLD
jgi:hypothetical protein